MFLPNLLFLTITKGKPSLFKRTEEIKIQFPSPQKEANTIKRDDNMI